jgi:hypothetical protein
MKFLILVSIIALSVIGIVGVQSIDAIECLSPCQSHQHLKVSDTLGNTIDTANLNQQYTLSWNLNNYLSKFVPCQEIKTIDAIDIGGYNKTTPVERCISGGVWEIDESINDHPHSPVIVLFQVTDDEKRTEYLAWIEASVPPNDSKKFEFSWTPAKTGQHTLTVFTWKSLDNPTALLSPTATSVNVND